VKQFPGLDLHLSIYLSIYLQVVYAFCATV
jgi:hypothetical protein